MTSIIAKGPKSSTQRYDNHRKMVKMLKGAT